HRLHQRQHIARRNAEPATDAGGLERGDDEIGVVHAVTLLFVCFPDAVHHVAPAWARSVALLIRARQGTGLYGPGSAAHHRARRRAPCRAAPGKQCVELIARQAPRTIPVTATLGYGSGAVSPRIEAKNVPATEACAHAEYLRLRIAAAGQAH